MLSDIVTAVINGSDGCVFCYGHAQLGKCRRPDDGLSLGSLRRALPVSTTTVASFSFFFL